MSTTQLNWTYDEFQQIGVDFANREQVERYTQNQGTRPVDEQALIERLGIGPNHTVIEFGCGTGVFALEATAVCQHLYAVDVSPAMLDYVRDRAQQRNITNLTTVHAGFLSYEHAGPAADFVVSKYVLHHLPDFWKMVALQRIAAMLSPGGTLYLRDVIFSFPPATYEASINGWIERVAQPASEGFTAAEFAMHVREEYSTYHWIIEGLLQRAGFTIIESNYLTAEHAEYRAIKH